MKKMPIFGKTTIGVDYTSLLNRIRGAVFVCPEDGTAESISVATDNFEADSKAKAALYTDSDFRLVGVTEELVGPFPAGWVTFRFLDPKPILRAGVAYILVAWSPSNISIYRDFVTENVAREQTLAYGNFPDPLTPEVGVSEYSIYCTYSIGVAPLTVDVNPKSASLYVDQSVTFVATVSGGQPPYTVNWIDNSTKEIIGTGNNHVFNAVQVGNFQIYAETTDNLGALAQSNTVPITVSTPPVPPLKDDDFNDNILDAQQWEEFKYMSGQPTEQNQRLECNCPGGYDVAGINTINSYDLSNAEIYVELGGPVTAESLGIFILETIYRDEAGVRNPLAYPQLSRGYCIYKSHKYDCTRIRKNNDLTDWRLLFTTPDNGWLSPNGSLRIKISNGTIEFYEDQVLQFSEPFDPAISTVLHIVLVRLAEGGFTGMDYFDNFIQSGVAPPPPPPPPDLVPIVMSVVPGTVGLLLIGGYYLIRKIPR